MTAEPTVTSGMATVDALALLPIPTLDGLSEQQLVGNVCVWGGETLTGETAIRLNTRKLDDRLVFPRGCRSCVSRAAMRVLFTHSTGTDACQACQTEPACETGRALARVIRLGQR